MKSKKISIISIIAIIILIASMGCVDAANHSFTFTVDSEEVTAKLGDTITIDLGIADIDQTTDGINAIQGKMTYDEELFESVDIVTISESGWGVTLNKEEGNNLKGTFVITNMNSTKTNSTVAKLKARIKSDAIVDTGKIYLKDVFSSYGTDETEKLNKTITVNVLRQNDNPPTSDNNETPNTPSNDSQTPATGNTQKPNNTQKLNNTQKPATKLPKAGLSSFIGVASVVAIIGAIVGYIRYKKSY